MFVFLIGTKLVSAYEYPIPELGNCQNQRECHLYCEIPKNHAACWSYSTYMSQVLGETTPEEKMTALGISFPVTDLGNCPNLAACKAYCEAEENAARCQVFSQKTGLAGDERVLEKAGEELGCTTKKDCRAFCEQSDNRSKCTAFARRYHLKGNVKEKLLNEAKKTLGCISHDECKEYCTKKENRDRCENLGKKFHVEKDSKKERLVEAAQEKLGCTSFADCKAFCQNELNRDKCRNFGQQVSEGAKLKNLQNKGICNTVDECRQVCSESPDKCPGFNKRDSVKPDSLKNLNTRPMEKPPEFKPEFTPPKTERMTSGKKEEVNTE